MRVQSSRLVFLTRYRTKFREFLGEAVVDKAEAMDHPCGAVVSLIRVTACNRNQPGLQSARFRDHINCICRPGQDHINCH